VVSTGAGGGGVADAVAQTVAAFDSAVFRQVIGNFMSGVVVISTRYDGVDYGVSVSAIASLSLAPPLLLVCLNVNTGTQEAVPRARRFGVNILAEHQSAVADRFARPGPDKFAGVAVRTGRSGVPLLDDTLAVLECQVVDAVTAGTAAADPELVQDHRRLVDAYERADIDAVKRIMWEHNERAKANQRAGIERAGGQL
jgi:flavin reductase (DIM6/NTAB) family NADH-FMN oxidoreductase RutF